MDYLKYGLYGTAIVGAAVCTGGLGFIAYGFGSTGIAAGSFAAAAQAGTGNVIAGSIFSVLQSAGATGVFSTLAAAGGAAAGGSAAAVGVIKHLEN